MLLFVASLVLLLVGWLSSSVLAHLPSSITFVVIIVAAVACGVASVTGSYGTLSFEGAGAPGMHHFHPGLSPPLAGVHRPGAGGRVLAGDLAHHGPGGAGRDGFLPGRSCQW